MIAADLGDLVIACDLNPVLVRKQSGELRLVDALMQSDVTYRPESRPPDNKA